MVDWSLSTVYIFTDLGVLKYELLLNGLVCTLCNKQVFTVPSFICSIEYMQLFVYLKTETKQKHVTNRQLYYYHSFIFYHRQFQRTKFNLVYPSPSELAELFWKGLLLNTLHYLWICLNTGIWSLYTIIKPVFWNQRNHAHSGHLLYRRLQQGPANKLYHRNQYNYYKWEQISFTWRWSDPLG